MSTTAAISSDCDKECAETTQATTSTSMKYSPEDEKNTIQRSPSADLVEHWRNLQDRMSLDERQITQGDQRRASSGREQPYGQYRTRERACPENDPYDQVFRKVIFYYLKRNLIRTCV